jgi:hypothetical protein
MDTQESFPGIQDEERQAILVKINRQLRIGLVLIEREVLRGKISETEEFAEAAELYRWYEAKLESIGKNIEINDCDWWKKFFPEASQLVAP